MKAMKNRYVFWIVFSLVVALGAGFVGGILGERYYLQKRHGRGSAHPPSLEQMAKDLALTADQQEQIKKIFESNEAKLKELRSDMRGRLKAIRAEVKSEIDNVLTPEQRQKMEAMIKKYEARRKKESEERRERNDQKEQREKDKGEKK
jgi:Spy/CpxP family protein refolding chaperone